MQELGPGKVSTIFSVWKLLAMASSDFAFVKQILDSPHPLWVREGEVRSEPSSWLIAAVQTHSQRSSWKNKVLRAVRQGGSRISAQQKHFTLPGNCHSKTLLMDMQIDWQNRAHIAIRKTPSPLVRQVDKITFHLFHLWVSTTTLGARSSPLFSAEHGHTIKSHCKPLICLLPLEVKSPGTWLWEETALV